MKCSQCGHTLQQDGTCHICDSHDVLSPGTMLEGRYKVLGVVGSGGMGFVYKAIDTRLHNSVVAVKEMRAGVKGQHLLDKARKSFESEARMLSGLSHRSLPGVTDFFSVDKKWYLIMDFIDGINLEKYVENYGPIDEEQALRWAISLCDVLEYLHFQDPPIIFRDLKPSNIMLDSDGQLKLIDFGIARNFKPDTGSDTTYYFSSGFSPPEQYGEAQTDVRSDIYALAATLHYLVTGINPRKNPFEFANIQDVVDVSDQFNNTILKSVSLAPADRPSSVAEFRAMLIGDLAAELKSSEDDVFDPGVYQDLSPKPRRKMFVFLSVVTVIAVLIGGGVWAYGAINDAMFTRRISVGYEHLEEENYPQAIRSFEMAVETRATNIEAHLGLAKAYAAHGETDIAEQTFKKTLEIDPSLHEPYLALAEFYLEQKLPEKALTTLESFTGANSEIEALITELTTVAALELDYPELEISAGGTFALLAKINPVTAGNQPLEWSSSDIEVAEVSDEGVVTGKGEGATVITVATADGRKTASVNASVVSVSVPEGQWDSTRGNSVGNIVNTGIAATDGSWVYFRSNEIGAIYRMRHDGSEAEPLSNFGGRFINVVGDWIYYSGSSGISPVYRMRPDGSDWEGYDNDIRGDFLNVVGGWIYYSKDYNGSIYRVRTDGSNEERLNYDKCRNINVVDGWVYYNNIDDRGSIYRMRTNGSRQKKLNSDYSSYLNVAGGWIYFRNASHDGFIYRMRTDGSGEEQLNSQSSWNINVVGGWIYYVNEEDNRTIYRMLLDGSLQEKPSNDRSGAFNVVDGWIYYINESRDGELYRMRTDGSDRDRLP